MIFSSNLFLKVGLIRCFRELSVRKIRKFSTDHFYDEYFQFYDKKTDFRPGMEISSETTIPGISSETTLPGPVSPEPPDQFTGVVTPKIGRLGPQSVQRWGPRSVQRWAPAAPFVEIRKTENPLPRGSRAPSFHSR